MSGLRRPRRSPRAICALALLGALAGPPATSAGTAPRTPAGDAPGERTLFRPPRPFPGADRDFRFFVEMFHPDASSSEEEERAAADAFLNDRLLAAAAVAVGQDDDPAVGARIEARTARLWVDAYWSEVVRGAVEVSDEDRVARAPRFPEMVSLQQMTVASREEAEDLRRRVLAGEDFGELARARSTGMTASRGGVVGYVTRDSRMYPPDLLEALFRTAPGGIADVAETNLGFAVIRVLDRTVPEELRTRWAEANRDRLLHEAQAAVWRTRKAFLLRKHRVEVRQDVVERFARAREKGGSPAAMAGETVMTFDGRPIRLGDLVDPSGQGGGHGAETVSLLAARRAEDLAVASEARAQGLPGRFPDIAARERVLRDHLLAREYVARACGDPKPDEGDLRRYYERNRKRFARPRLLELSFVETRSPQRLARLYALLEAGLPFEDAARDLSDGGRRDAARSTLVDAESLEPGFEPVRRLKPGEYLRAPVVVEDAAGGGTLFVVPRLNAVHEARELAFDEVPRESLERGAAAVKKARVLAELLGRLRRGRIPGGGPDPVTPFRPGTDFAEGEGTK